MYITNSSLHAGSGFYDTGFRLLDLCVPLLINVLGISTNGYNLF